MIHPIRLYPDPCLRTPCSKIESFDETLRQLAADLADSMHAANGVGITGPHVGLLLRLVVIQLEGDERPRVYVNPVIAVTSTTRLRHREGSVSMPGVAEEIERAAGVTVRYQDLEGQSREEASEGFLAVCLQHEIDQLDGIFWLDRLSRLKRDRVIKRYEKLGRR